MRDKKGRREVAINKIKYKTDNQEMEGQKVGSKERNKRVKGT